MSTTNINVRVDRNLKQSAEALFNDLGLKLLQAMSSQSKFLQTLSKKDCQVMNC